MRHYAYHLEINLVHTYGLFTKHELYPFKLPKMTWKHNKQFNAKGI